MNQTFKYFNDGIRTDKPDRFHRVIRELKESLMDKSGMPVSYAMQDRNMLLEKGGHSDEEILSALEDVKLHDVEEVINKKVKGNEYQFTMLTMGNVGETEIKD